MASSKEKGPSDGWTHTWERETRTTASFDDVKKFYLEQVEKKGWKITSQEGEAGQGRVGALQGTELGAGEARGGSSGIVKITAEWKTR